MNRAKGFIEFIEMADKSPHLDSSTRSMANKYLSELSKTYHHEIPITELLKTLREKFGIIALQEDGTEWSGFLLGREGKMNLDVAKFDPAIGPDKIYQKYNNSMLVFSWYQMQSGTTYEINAYLS